MKEEYEEQLRMAEEVSDEFCLVPLVCPQRGHTKETPIKSSYLLKIYIIALFESSHECVEIKN